MLIINDEAAVGDDAAAVGDVATVDDVRAQPAAYSSPIESDIAQARRDVVERLSGRWVITVMVAALKIGRREDGAPDAQRASPR